MAADVRSEDDGRPNAPGVPIGAEQPAGCTLRDIRKLARMTRGQVAKAGGTTRYRVAKIEHAEDVGLAALNAHVEALGGKLEIEVEFPDRPTVVLRRKRRKWVASIKRCDETLEKRDQA
ncbi:MAG: hypothetical protein ACK4Y4_02795 [Brevundimonas sp.]